MRVAVYPLLVLWVALVAAFAQDTNFATGPQYLMNYGSPMFARSISTPSLSLSEPALAVGARDASADLSAGGLNQTVLSPSAVSSPTVDLFPVFYGTPPPQSIDIEFSEASPSNLQLPVSILGTGVWQITTPQALRESGYEVTLPEAAAYAKGQTRRASRLYTNADIARLRSGS
jgi:hypothetical protein